MKAILIIVFWSTTGMTSRQIEFPDMASCEAAVDQLPNSLFSGIPQHSGFCLAVPADVEVLP